ncbi:MAG: hypothetical protein IJ875_00585 [Solobacterium sp.]|nr:hypothetical protein [Solobacterium sp.]
MSLNEVIEENEGLEIKEERSESFPFSVAVKFRGANKPYSFGCFDSSYRKGDWVVVETAQGIEMGYVEADALNIEKYGLHMPDKPVLRRATEYDQRTYEENDDLEKEAYAICAEEIADLNLNMNLLSAQYTLDRTQVLFIYLSEQRVDFRELLKRLGSRLRCRIELRQIGERDKAKMVGGIGLCGMECCCRRFKNRFDQISINMAKNQLLALNTEKLSGMCGKLMCCLKYEDDIYTKLTEGLPKMGSQVEYEGDIFRITSMNVMNEEVKLENHETVLFLTLDELREKAIPRKGVVMQRKSDSEEKKVVVRSSAVKQPEETVKHVSMELPTVDVAKKQRNENRNHSSNNRDRNSYRERNNRRHETTKSEETKNVTVRTFGKKKTSE